MTQPPELDAETRARIYTEEAERIKARETILKEKAIKERPSYWTGVIFGVMVVGTGLMYLGRFGLGVMWLLITIVIAVSLNPLVGWIFGAVGSFFHYDSIYGNLYATEAEKASEEKAGNTTKYLAMFIGGVLMFLFLLTLYSRANR